jgi:hypothetical protein
MVAHIDARRAARALTVSGEPEVALPPAPLAGERARRLFQEARSISLEHIKALQHAIAETRELAQAMVDGGDLYVVGLQDFASRLAQELFTRGKLLETLTERQRVAVRAR